MAKRCIFASILLLPSVFGGYDDYCDCLVPGDCSSAGLRPPGFFHGDEDDCCECLIPGVPASCVASCFDVTSGTCAELSCVAHDTCVIGTSRDVSALTREGKTCGAVCTRSRDECEQLVAFGGHEVAVGTQDVNTSTVNPGGDGEDACEETASSSPSIGPRWLIAVGTYTEAVTDLPDHAVTCGGNPNPACGGAGVHIVELTKGGRPKLAPSFSATAPTLQTDTATRSLIGPNPSFVEWHPSAPCIFATSELGERASTTRAMRVELEGLKISVTSEMPSNGYNPSSLAISADGRLLAVSYFLGGGVDTYEVDPETCSLTGPRGLLDSTVAGPPEGGLMMHHVHFFPPSVEFASTDAVPADAPQWLIAIDFGHDRLVALRAPLFESDSAVVTNLSDEASAECADSESPGSTYRTTMFCGGGVLGVRHLTWGSVSPDGGVFAYASLQRAQGVLALRFDPKTGEFDRIGTIVPAGESCVEPSALHTADNTLFLACRIDGDGGSHGFMLRFAIDPTSGAVESIIADEMESHRATTRGAVPRDFKLVHLPSKDDATNPDLLAVVANQGSNSLFVLNASNDLSPVDFHPLGVPASVAVRQFSPFN